MSQRRPILVHRERNKYDEKLRFSGAFLMPWHAQESNRGEERAARAFPPLLLLYLAGVELEEVGAGRQVAHAVAALI